MKLWTIQPVNVISKIALNGSYHAEKEYIEWLEEENFRRSYHWLVDQMKERIESYPDIDYPIWAWCKKPDFRRSGLATKGQYCYCLELEIPEEKMVLTNFDSWHYVLNNWFLSDDTEEQNIYDNLSPEQQEEAKLKSWQKIFVSKDQIPAEEIQATFWQTTEKDIKDMRTFMAR